jgi:WD40 repeat protein/serine/threonine protein kinase/tetratricopeptide (TPR) repeat protein
MMADANRCPNCGAERPANAPEGLCPRCLMSNALGEEPAGAAEMTERDSHEIGAQAVPGATQTGTEAAEAPIVGTGEGSPPAVATGVWTGDADGAAVTTDGNGEASDLGRGARVRYFGDYEIRRVLGRGGMGVVYEARQISLNRMVALKMVKAGLLAGDDELRRFQNEAEAVALLDHPGVVPVYEVGDHDGQRYFSMKLVTGGSLVSMLEKYQGDPKAAAALVAEAAEAVAHAHMRGILHRDVKPANILVDEQGHSHVTDFGLAKRVEADVELTQSGAILGTPAYMSPEQATGRRGSITTATDVYGLGAVLYALLTGKAPFGGDSVMETIDAVRNKPPEPPARLNTRVPADLETICLKCLEKDSRRRYPTAQALADELRAWLGNRPIAARRVGSGERAWLWSRRNPWLAGAIGSTAAGVVAVALISTIFAVEQTRAKNRITGLANDLRTSLNQSESLAGELKVSLKESRTRLARLDFERASNAFEKEQIGPGLLRLVQSWRSAIAADDAGWQHTARMALSIWQRQYLGPRTILHHEKGVHEIAFSPDGKTVLTGSFDHTARLWDAASGQPIGSPMLHQNEVLAVAFSPDGKAVLTGSMDNTVRLWDATGRPLIAPLRHNDWVNVVAFSPDGKTVLSGSFDFTARLWDATTGRPIGSPMRHLEAIEAIAFSPDGKAVLTGSRDNTARLWDATTGQPLGPPLRHEGTGWVRAVAFSPDGNSVLTAGDDNTARLWDAATNRPIAPPLWHQSLVFDVAFSPDGKTVLTGSDDCTARLWDAATGRSIGSPIRHHSGVSDVAFSPDGKTVLTSSGNAAWLWDVATGQPISLPMQHLSVIHRVAFSHDGKLVLTGSEDSTARIWNVMKGRPGGLPLQHHAPVWAVAFSPDGRTVVTGSRDHTARLWDAATGRAIGAPMQHFDHVTVVAFSPDGKTVVTGSADHSARLWDAASGEPLGPPMWHQNVVVALAFSPDRKTVVTGSRDNTARLWDVATGQPIGPPLQHRNNVVSVAFSPVGKSVVTGSRDNTARLWDATTGQPFGVPMQHQNAVHKVAFSPDGKSVLTGSEDGTAQLWDAATGRSIGVPMQHQSGVNAVAFSPDSKLVLTGSEDRTARIWGAATGRPLGSPLQHAFPLRSVAFSPDSKTVLTSSYHDAARFWDDATGQPLGPPLPHDGTAFEAAFSPDGRTILTGGSDNVARLWDVAELPDEPDRVAAWVSKVTGLGLDDHDQIKLLDSAAQSEIRERLESLGGSPAEEPRWSLDPILFGPDPAACARAWVERGRNDLAMAALNEALRARPLYAPLWAERARFHAAQGHREQAAEDAAQAALVCWNDPKLGALAQNDAAFRDEALDEILRMQSTLCRMPPEVWRGRGRRRAARGDWAGALREFAASATPVQSLSGADLLTQACLLHLAGDDTGATKLANDVRGFPEPVPGFDQDGAPILDTNVQMQLWVRLLDDPPGDPADLVHRALKYVTKNKGAASYVLGMALLRTGRLDQALLRFQESLAVQRDWANHGLNAYGLALAHYRLGHSDEARRWLERADSWLNNLDRIYAVEGPAILSGQPQAPVTFEFWVYAQLVRREAAGPILDAIFPADPFAR